MAQAFGDVEVGWKIAALAQQNFASWCVMRRDAEDYAQYFVQVDRGAVGHHDFARSGTDQPCDLVAQALWLADPACVVPRTDQALAPLMRDHFCHPRDGGLGQRAQRIAIQVNHAFGQAELVAQMAQRVQGVELLAVAEGFHGAAKVALLKNCGVGNFQQAVKVFQPR